jgi:acyl-CoA thioesterase I
MMHDQSRERASTAVRVGSTTAGTVIKVACVGDSITRGTFVWQRKKRSYPAQLQRMLGDGFCVRSFGVNGHAAQRSADRPYWKTEEFTSSGTFRPDIVLIMLGTNDSRGDNWKGVDSFSGDYRDLVVHYQSLESRPAVWLMTPPALFRLGRETKVRYGMDELALREMCGAIERLAGTLDCGFVDVRKATADHPEAFRFDGVHPGAAGATLIARAVFAALTE